MKTIIIRLSEVEAAMLKEIIARKPKLKTCQDLILAFVGNEYAKK